MYASRILIVSALGALPVVSQQAAPITAPAGPPQLIETGGAAATLAMTEAEYLELASKIAKMPGFVAMAKKPAAAGPNARFGVNFTYGAKNRTWALDGNDETGYVLYADLNANGDLNDDAPMRMELKDGKFATYFETTASTDGESYPVRMKLVVGRLVPPGKTDKELALLRYDNTQRLGEITVAGKPIKFSLAGSLGIYSQAYQGIRIDLNGDGALDDKTEGYLNSEKVLNIGEVSYEFSVDRFGRSLTLRPLLERRPDRVILQPGYVAPDFSFVDLAGAKRQLSDLRGRVVLIDFWGTWCAPCVAALPKLQAAYEKYNADGLEILGVDSGDSRVKLEAFLAERKITWPQTMEADKGPIATLYRVTGWPTYFLLDRDGKIVVAGGTELDLPAELAKLFAGK